MTPSGPPQVQCLLVDDVEENLTALGALLEMPGLEVITARSGPEALTLLPRHDFALVLLDVFMPGMDGFEVAERIRAMPAVAGVPIIFITASPSHGARLFRGYEAGAVDFLHKPVDPLMLRGKVKVFVELHRQRLLLAQQLEERDRSLKLNQMFMSVLGHDLRSPLFAMLAGAEVLRECATPERVEKVSQMMVDCGNRMRRMIADLLDVTRARAEGGLPIERQEIDLGVLTERLVQEQRAQHPGRLIEVESQGALSGCFDGDRLAQVLANLLGNAIQHGSTAAPVSIRLDGREPELLVVAVLNAGSVPPERVATLFDPFSGTQRVRRGDDGLGLGLFIARQIVLAHGGQIEACSDERGTELRFTLPRKVQGTERDSHSG